MKSKTFLAGGIISDILFRNEACLNFYLDELNYRSVDYRILEELRREDGSIIIRIVRQYNNLDLIEFPEAE